MKILFLHGWHSTPGGRKPQYFQDRGHQVLNPALLSDDFEASVAIAQNAYDTGSPDLIIGSSRGGAVALNITSGSTPTILICPAWKNWGDAKRAKPGTVIMHSPSDETIPFSQSQELHAAGPDGVELIACGAGHRMAEPETLALVLKMGQKLVDTARR